MKNYKELTEYYKDSSPNQILEDLYLDLLHRTETINKLSRKIQKLRKRIKREQELKVFQYEMKVQSYEELINLQDRIKKALEYIDRRDIEWASDEHDKLIEILKGENNE